MTDKNKKIGSILIANRAEIAVRIIRAARDLGIKSIAVYSEADEGSLHVRLADEKIPLGGSTAKDTYLHIDKIIAAAKQSGADAIHPGYGFLAENEEFAERVENEGIIFIGPNSKVIRKMGDKLNAREAAEKANVPILPGLLFDGDIEKAKEFSNRVGYPLIIKATAGGSGRGIRVCHSEKELANSIEDASKEAESAFGSGTVFIEKFLSSPKHIEIQIAGDKGGNAIHFFERECSLQRRRQKLLEEAPASTISQSLRDRIAEAAVRLAKEVEYESVGTMEFLVEEKDGAGSFYFLEMNTRIQVEHPVTEEITGVDLLTLQIKIAEGENIVSYRKDSPNGHALEFRLYSEDVKDDFRPLTGKISQIILPSGPGVRVDSWIENHGVVSPYYDALLAKIIVKGSSRKEAIARAKRALHETVVDGIGCNLGFFRWLLDQPSFIMGTYHIKWLENEYKGEEGGSFFVGPL